MNKKIGFITILCVLCIFSMAGIVSSQAVIVTSAPRLTAAQFYCKTGGDNKNHDSGVYVTVVTNDQKTILAEIKNADNSARDETAYNDHSDHSIDLVVKSPGSTNWIATNINSRLASVPMGWIGG